MALSARAFGKRYSVSVSQETLANDVGVSGRTIIRHLNVLEALHLIRRIRIGRGMTNTIILTLKVGNPDSLSNSIAKGSKELSQHILNRQKLTMKEALVLSAKHKKRQKEAALFMRQADAILASMRSGEW